MRVIRTEIQISSKPDKVWRMLMDLPGWSDWNPIVNRIEGKTETGAELLITTSDEEGNDGKRYKSIVTEIVENKKFSFVGTMMGKSIFRVERIIELEDAKGGTLLIQREIYSGLLIPLLWKNLSKYVPPMLNSMNRALRNLVEGD